MVQHDWEADQSLKYVIANVLDRLACIRVLVHHADTLSVLRYRLTLAGVSFVRVLIDHPGGTASSRVL